MDIKVNMNEINSVEKIISNLLSENDIYSMNNNILNKEEINNKFLFPNSIVEVNSKLVSIEKSNTKTYKKTMTEEEFFKTVGATKNGISRKSSIYQEKLYSNYIEALDEKDEGYLYDVLNKALEFKNNLNYVKSLIKNKSFIEEWRKDFGDESAVEIFKQKGSLRLVNIVKERTIEN